MGAVALMLLVACADVANLMLAPVASNVGQSMYALLKPAGVHRESSYILPQLEPTARRQRRGWDREWKLDVVTSRRGVDGDQCTPSRGREWSMRKT